MNNEKFFKDLEKQADNGKAIKSRLNCAVGAALVLILIALLVLISNSRLGQLLLRLIY